MSASTERNTDVESTIQNEMTLAGGRKTAETAIQTVADVTRYHASERAGYVASWFEGRQTTYGQLDERTNRIAQALLADGVTKGDRVAYVGRNSDRYFELLFGSAKVGAVVVPVSWRLTSQEITYIVHNCGARLVFADDTTSESIASIAAELPAVKGIVAMENPVYGWLGFTQWYGVCRSDDPQVLIYPNEAVVQLYTSGTTGHPKGVELSHANLVNAFFGPMNGGEPWAQWNDRDVLLSAMPIAHISGTGSGFLGYCAGALNIITREFLPGEVLQLLSQHGVTKMFLVPSAIQLLLRLPNVRETEFSRLQYMLYGASPIPLDLLREAVSVFGCGFCQMYGMTETTGPIVCLPPEDHDPNGNERMRSAGRPYDYVELRIRKTDGTLAATGEVGEVETRSTHNMIGYAGQPQTTLETLSADGWLKTGDAGYLDEDGYLYIKDRIKELIISGGENIYPAEVESAVFGHPDVLDAAVIGVPDDTWGEAVKAIVVAKPGTDPDPDAIIAFAKTRVAGFKAPKSVDFIESIPRNATGKILRRVLREPYWKDCDRQVN